MGFMLAGYTIEFLTRSYFLGSVSDVNFRFISGVFGGLLSGFAVFFLTIFLWRWLLYIINLISKNELRKHPFYIGRDSEYN